MQLRKPVFVSYAYDAAGRRVSQGGTAPFVTTANLPTPTTATALYDANNRLTLWNGATFTYDANGNLAGDGQKTYTWDTRNQLQGITGAATGNFSYDAFGRRIYKNAGGQQTGYLYDGANFVQELNGPTAASGAKANLLTGGIDETFQRSTTTTTSHFLTNALGSTTALTDASGNTTATYSYDPYGNTTKAGSDTNSQTYTGREDDGTGLFYYRARYYMPSCGRFISEDPIGWASGQTNDYAYVGGDPVGFNDPDGRIAIVPALLIIGGTVWAAWQGYQAGQEYGQMECATKKKFDDRASNPENWTEAQNGARAAEQVSNGMSTFGPFVLKGAIGVALAGAGGSFVGAGFALTGATVGFMAGKADYTCQ